MLAEAWGISRRALSRGGPWTVLVWTVVFMLLVFGSLVLVGASALLASFLHPHFGVTPSAASVAGPAIGGILLLYVILLAAGPFFMAGAYGVFGLAVQGQAVSWGTFWAMGKKLYGRGWGLVLYGLLYAIGLGIVAAVLMGLLHVLGTMVTGLLMVMSLPWALRMIGGLFVDQLSWGAAFAASFQGARYGGLLGSMFLSAIGYSLIWGLGLLLIHVWGPIGIVCYFGLDIALSVVGPTWFFALYVAAQPRLTRSV